MARYFLPKLDPFCPIDWIQMSCACWLITINQLYLIWGNKVNGLLKKWHPSPAEMRSEFIRAAKDTSRIRSMPVAHYPATFPSIRGYVGLGDHANQRHPLTGGGMTCAFNDVLRLAKSLAVIPRLRGNDVNDMAEIEDRIQKAILQYSQKRFLHCGSINILSWALYAVFQSPPLRDACLDYFMLGGDCVDGPISLLSGWNSAH
ncbi:putative squalene monooxygenase [Trypanosoma cruzi]|uniref:Squalene monooxygenase n=1 Tax=Trypanosoma cruzi TaxID=5693 RepID=A0A2V2VA34_TRYCR|nr:putative squalene monooxygenase [Trypanosoma cruzi]